jgi:hypothetical protein
MGTGLFLRQEFLYVPLPVHICSTGRFGLGPEITNYTNNINFNSTVWPADNRAIYAAIRIPSYFTVAQFMVANGTDTTGNVDVGLYDCSGTRLISTGTQSRSGARTTQYFGVTDQGFPPGHYYLALVASSTTGRYRSTGSGFNDSAGWLQEDLGSTVLPSTMSPISQTSGTFFAFGFSQSDTL